jgi:hypothetical protein
MVNRNFLLKIIVFLKIMILFTHNLQADANTFRLSVDFKNEIEKNNLQMIIYYNSNFYTMTHLTDEEIRNGYYEYKIIINTKILNNNLI